MKYIIISSILLLSLSCTQKGKAVVVNTISIEDTIVSPKKVTLLFAGDLMQHITQIKAAFNGKEYDYSECFRYVKDEISNADIAIGNLEVTIGGKPYSGYPTFSAPDEFLFSIKDAGFDVLLTANNHCLDKGKKGLERTVMMMDSLNFIYAGCYINENERSQKYPLFLEKDGIRISLLNYTYGTNGLKQSPPNIVNYIDKEVMSKDIQAAKSQQPDVIIACMHWGDEYKLLPNKEQKDLTEWLFEQGVTHIIGGHPHVVQPMELRTDSLTEKQNIILYSLGNFISNMSAVNTDGGIMFKMELTKDSTSTYVSDCGYSSVWTAKKGPKRKNHTLIPANFPVDSLSTEEQGKMKVFLNNARNLFSKHNRNINEYTFY